MKKKQSRSKLLYEWFHFLQNAEIKGRHSRRDAESLSNCISIFIFGFIFSLFHTFKLMLFCSFFSMILHLSIHINNLFFFHISEFIFSNWSFCIRNRFKSPKSIFKNYFKFQTQKYLSCKKCIVFCMFVFQLLDLRGPLGHFTQVHLGPADSQNPSAWMHVRHFLLKRKQDLLLVVSISS